MQHRLNHLFAQLKWYEALEFSAMALYVISVSIHWRTGIWALAILALCSIVKLVASHKVGNPILTKTSRICLVLMVLYFLLFLTSIFYSSSPFSGLNASGKKLPMLIIPFFFLFSDLSYIRRKHISALSLLLAVVLTLRFSIMLVQAILDLMAGEQYKQVIQSHFDPMHYNYLALYIVSAIILLFFEAMRYWRMPRWRRLRWMFVADLLVMVEYILILGSRSGLLTMIMVIALLAAYLFLLKEYRIGIILTLGFALFLGLNHLITPELFSRAESTIEKMEKGEDGDVRQDLWRCGWDLVEEHEIIGYGNQGYNLELYQEYIDHDLSGSYKNKLNTHNQYLETLVALGIIGLVLLLTMIVLPAILASTRKYWNPIMVVFSILYAAWIFFEVGFARQMGLLFICWWYGVLISFPKHYPAPLVDIPFLHKRHTPEA